MKHILSTAAIGLSLFVSASAFAAEGYVTRNVSLRAGPDFSYPAVTRIRAGTSVSIEGCVDGWSWCDVDTGGERGWMAGNYLQEEYEGRRVLVPNYGVQIGIPIVSFAFGSYWDDHYRNRSWYSHRERWSHVRPRYSAWHGDERRSSGGEQRGSHDRAYDGRRGTSYGTNETIYRSSRQSMPSGVDAPRESYRQRSADTVTQQAPVVRQARSPQRDTYARPIEHNAPVSAPTRAAEQPRVVTERSAPVNDTTHHGREQPRVIAERRAPAPNASAAATTERPAHDNHGQGKDKAKDKDKDKDKDQNQH